MDEKALILNIQRMSTEDGPGIRTTVFFKGCSLSCSWCHNPESISPNKEIQWVETKCIGCGLCMQNCPNGALASKVEGIFIDKSRCKACLKCTEECPGLAMEVKGEDWSIDSLVSEVLKDRVYFEKSGGGITLSGGEVLLQGKLAVGFLKKLKELGIHTAVDTCGMCSEKVLREAIEYCDMILYDIKLMDREAHKRFTGQYNDKILKNLMVIAECMRTSKKPKELWIRTPVIPGATDSEENIEQIAGFIDENMVDIVSKWELCAFNNLCRDKYRRLYIDWDFKEAELLEREKMERLSKLAAERISRAGIVCWSGAVKIK